MIDITFAAVVLAVVTVGIGWTSYRLAYRKAWRRAAAFGYMLGSVETMEASAQHIPEDKHPVLERAMTTRMKDVAEAAGLEWVDLNK